ncbi:exodeoxyribonuclease VII large subunit [Leptolyngbyaceae cyanobacterium CCMR0082]|uniref:Exodeoxyribonuclease 7 large subunit n=2 Tax=Adonisia turfae TaxID=2950184 RepID=A0A6M0S2A7_9CYAN|nr:exodeoxyribonuclease VII large subunit [Adonisia turfae]MDV3347732.1 exodeoxyribonuclease VII large subunit [Leptothoe sp. LEGE 181152]NEZ60483.1 exodeoxyribonuclease VII large subunit [Adonisia turfae CCMR0081]NEZ62609.1 exodeoxyribonuclease VII large subunit [Adonisia turfae CCMR0082]
MATEALDFKAISVAGVTEYIQLLLEGDENLRNVWVIGEVSSARNHGSGCFFSLQETDGSATLNAVVWRSQLPKLNVIPTVGEQVVVLGQLKVYPKRGSYQLTTWQVLPAGAGLQALRYRQLRNRLAREGLFDEARKRPLPALPTCIAVVTSPQAAAWGDIQETLNQRHPGLNVLLSPAMVQGEQAPRSIAQAIERVGIDGRADVLLLGRGGGAVEDLVCFDDERVVRAIATCPIPVITGIGHERDESLADLVADVYAHTPTAAAEQIVPALRDLRYTQGQQLQRLAQATGTRLFQHKQDLQQLYLRLQQLQPQSQLAQAQQAQDWRTQRLIKALTQRLQTAQHQHQLLNEKLVTLDPAAVLRRGYALVRATAGGVVNQASSLSPGDHISVQLGQGQIEAEVLSVTEEAKS